MRRRLKEFSWGKLAWCGVALAIAVSALPRWADAQDYDDPPARVARLGYIEGSVSFQPAGESDWVGAVRRLPDFLFSTWMTTRYRSNSHRARST